MKLFKYILLFIGLQINLNTSAENVPTAIQDSLKALYPSVQTIGWNTDQAYYVAGFRHNGFDMKVWFDTIGHWVMKQTDWQVMDEAPEAVWHTFTFGPYSTDEVLDVTLVEFPQKESQVVIHLGEDNAETEYQLFYLTDGELINARNVTNLTNILGANTFL
ncbi:MAG: PepSY-like domain-containing protein [Bacteroidaceae bacterium]|nr:PepSY-like domain-containing protein [Bacteroidaceae bacterium]